MADKITFENKEVYRVNPLIEKYKGTAGNFNEIKAVVNSHADGLDALTIQPHVTATWIAPTGFSFACTGINVPFDNVLYNGIPSTVTLDDPEVTTDIWRIDIIGMFKPIYPETEGTFGVVKGDALDKDLVVPPDYDPSEFYPIKNILLKDGATVPSDPNSGNVFTNEIIYLEGDNEPTEWNVSTNDAVAINVQSSTDPKNGTYSIEATNVSFGDYVKFQSAEKLNTDDLSFISWWMKLKYTFKYKYINVDFYNGTTRVGSRIRFNNGSFGFVSTNLNYQQIIINSENLNLPTDTEYDTVIITPYINGYLGWFIDDVLIQQGSSVVSPPSTNHTHPNKPVLDTITQELLDKLAFNPATWDKNLAPTDDTLQKIFDKVDDLETGGGSGASLIEVTYSELTALISASGLVKGQRYLLTDYMTTYTQPVTDVSKSSGIVEPLYLTALDVNKLSQIAYSKLYPQDIVYYEVTCDIGDGYGTEGFTKGKIYRRIDTIRNNDIGTDWRHVKYDRSGTDKLLFEDYDGCYNNVIKTYFLFNSVIGNYFYSNTIDDYFYSNTIGNYFYSNTIGDGFESNTIGDGASSNTIKHTFYLNEIGSGFKSNLIENNFADNTILDHFNTNTISTYFNTNTIGNAFSYNKIDTEFSSNTVGDNIQHNQFTVVTLPSGNKSIGQEFMVTDALSPTYLGVAVGGGTIKCKVFWNGTNWITH